MVFGDPSNPILGKKIEGDGNELVQEMPNHSSGLLRIVQGIALFTDSIEIAQDSDYLIVNGDKFSFMMGVGGPLAQLIELPL
jgi:hypothetical protein